MKTTGQRLKHFRKNILNISQTEFASKLGVSRGVIANIENEITELKPQFAMLISRVFGVDLEWLESGEGSPDRLTDEETSLTHNYSRLLCESLMCEPTDFKRLFVSALPDIDEKQWNVLRDIYKRIAHTSTAEPDNADTNRILRFYFQLNSEGRAEAIKRVEELTQIPKYTTPDDTDKEEA